VDDSRKRIEALTTELEIIGREKAIGIDTAAREASVNEMLVAERERLAVLDKRWADEKTLVDELLGLRGKLRGALEKVEGTGSKLEADTEAAKPPCRRSCTRCRAKAR
jgi:type VI secretion system protein VasG